MKTFQDFLHIMDFNGNQTVQGPNESFSAASKGFKRHQTMNKGLINPLKKRFVHFDEWVQTGDSRTLITEQSKASICAYKT